VKLPLKPLAVLGLLKELRVVAADDKPITVGGVLAEHLVKELGRDGDRRAVRVGGPDGAAVYVHVLGAAPTDEDEAMIARAHRQRVPVVALAREHYRIPNVLPTDVVVIPPGRGFPVDGLAGVIAALLG